MGDIAHFHYLRYAAVAHTRSVHSAFDAEWRWQTPGYTFPLNAVLCLVHQPCSPGNPSPTSLSQIEYRTSAKGKQPINRLIKKWHKWHLREREQQKQSNKHNRSRTEAELVLINRHYIHVEHVSFFTKITRSHRNELYSTHNSTTYLLSSFIFIHIYPSMYESVFM